MIDCLYSLLFENFDLVLLVSTYISQLAWIQNFKERFNLANNLMAISERL